MLPQVNATLLSITAGESVGEDDWDAVVSQSGVTLRWSGGADAYYMEKVRTTFSGGEGGLQIAKDVTIIVSSNIFDNNNISLEVGDVLTFLLKGVTHMRRVMQWSAAYLPGMGIQSYTRINLRPEPIEDTLEQN